MQKNQRKNQLKLLSILFYFALLNPILLAYSKVSINGVFYSIEEVISIEDKAKGLMFRKTLGKNHGMLFSYDTEKVIPIWMKNTYLPLDIIWINKNGLIVDIQQGKPLSEKILYPKSLAKYVLELPQGETLKSKAKNGTKVTFID